MDFFFVRMKKLWTYMIKNWCFNLFLSDEPMVKPLKLGSFHLFCPTFMTFFPWLFRCSDFRRPRVCTVCSVLPWARRASHEQSWELSWYLWMFFGIFVSSDVSGSSKSKEEIFHHKKYTCFFHSFPGFNESLKKFFGFWMAEFAAWMCPTAQCGAPQWILYTFYTEILSIW